MSIDPLTLLWGQAYNPAVTPASTVSYSVPSQSFTQSMGQGLIDQGLMQQQQQLYLQQQHQAQQQEQLMDTLKVSQSQLLSLLLNSNMLGGGDSLAPLMTIGDQSSWAPLTAANGQLSHTSDVWSFSPQVSQSVPSIRVQQPVEVVDVSPTVSSTGSLATGATRMSNVFSPPDLYSPSSLFDSIEILGQDQPGCDFFGGDCDLDPFASLSTLDLTPEITKGGQEECMLFPPIDVPAAGVSKVEAIEEEMETETVTSPVSSVSVPYTSSPELEKVEKRPSAARGRSLEEESDYEPESESDAEVHTPRQPTTLKRRAPDAVAGEKEESLNDLSMEGMLSAAQEMAPSRGPFMCPYPGCGKPFKKLYNLKSHLICHSGEKPHSCKQCGHTFRRRHDLKRHLRTTHTTNKPFQCRYCSRAFARKDHYTRHMNIEARMIAAEEN